MSFEARELRGKGSAYNSRLLILKFRAMVAKL